MARERLPDTHQTGRRRRSGASLPLTGPVRPEDPPPLSPRELLLTTWPGRLFLIGAGLKILVALWRLTGMLPTLSRVLSSAATIALIISVGYFVTKLFVLMKQRLLWRVRRRLILSYIFIGVVPTLLIAGFFLLAGSFVTGTVGAYVFRNGYEAAARNAQLLAEAAAIEIGRNPRTAEETVDRVQRNGARSLRYPTISIAFVPASAESQPAIVRGRWEHLKDSGEPLPGAPDWARSKSECLRGTTWVLRKDAGNDPELVIRALCPAGSQPKPVGWVIVDLPLDATMLNRLYEETGVKAGTVRIVRTNADGTTTTLGHDAQPPSTSTNLSLFGNTVSWFDAYDWPTGRVARTTVGLTFRTGELYRRLSAAQTLSFRGLTVYDTFRILLAILGVLFLIIELVALVMGLALARSITSSIHELFMGTERVRQGDFTHRIKTGTKDQLGQLAGSFNQMTSSIENLLQTAAEKKRLEEELRIARQIQMSLLPRGPLDMPGLGVTALCVPAREVGGDYYDFFPLENNRLGVLIADVAGKGTSAALYMAELKGLVLSLSKIYQSPRQLLIEANRILAENLDSRSFITMTYAVLDLGRNVMTYARAGHTPLIYFPAQTPGGRPAAAQVLVPNGMVVGLRIDGAVSKFNDLLEEKEIRLQTGDVIVFYTDGITEAMNTSSDLFGESRLSRIVEEHGHLDSGELRERILREIEAFVGSADQHDDMTMILIKVMEREAARVAV
jgi:sigma-B regulation protein RsbU (phosphoserine phosphatase)